MKLQLLILSFLCYQVVVIGQGKIDRKSVVNRHNIALKQIDTLGSLSIGNGKFCFTTDFTGLQTFPEYYKNGIPLGTQSDWAWHEYPNDENYRIDDVLKSYFVNGRTINYAVQDSSNERSIPAVKYIRQNPHRLQLAHIGFHIVDDADKLLDINKFQSIGQHLNLWTGALHSSFIVENEKVEVITYCHQQKDIIGVKVISNLILKNKLRLSIRLPYPTYEWTDEGVHWLNNDKHHSNWTSINKNSGEFYHQLDNTKVNYHIKWTKTKGMMKQYKPHYFVFYPDSNVGKEMEFFCHLSASQIDYSTLNKTSFKNLKKNNEESWSAFWKSGGAIDFKGSTDLRAIELERRVILSQYLTKIQCTGLLPPQETGLTYNSWYGKPHLEMYWWHAMHFIQWGRYNLVKRGMTWYKNVASKAKDLANRQGFDGVRWQKMTDPLGKETPSSVGSFLIWQQPHIIYLAEQAYQNADKNCRKIILSEYQDLIFKTADFMASYAYFDSVSQRYILGPALMPAQERFDVKSTINPSFELAYWAFGLELAQKWRQRLGLPINSKYQTAIDHLSPLPIQDNVYLPTQSAEDGYKNPRYLTDHPTVLGAFGFLPPTEMVDKTIIANTLNKVWKEWYWEETWGWDFPLVAMTAARLGQSERAVDALMMPIKTNTYLVNGHNYQDNRLRLYLPGNGGLLSAVALMCELDAFPKNGKWKVRWEGVKTM